MIKKCALALFLGAVCSLFFVEHDRWASLYVGKRCIDFFSKQYGCNMMITVDAFTLFDPTLSCRDLVVSSSEGPAWQWQASHVTMGFSWWNFLLYGVVNLSVHITDLSVQISSLSALKGFQEHLNLLSKPTKTLLPCTINEITIDTAAFHLQDQESQTQATLIGGYVMRRGNGRYRGLLRVTEGSYTHRALDIVQAVSGSLLIDFPSGTTSYDMTGECTCVIPRLPEKQQHCFIRGNWNQNLGTGTLVNTEHTFTIDPISLTKTEQGLTVQAHLHATAAHGAALVGFSDTELFQGVVEGKTTVVIGPDTWDGQIEVRGSDCQYAGQSLGSSCTLVGNKIADTCQGTISVCKGTKEQGTGSWHYSCETKSGTLHMTNTVEFSIPTTTVWEIGAHDAALDAKFNVQGVTGTYRLQAHHRYKKNNAVMSGTFRIHDNKGQVEGVCDSVHYRADLDLKSAVPLQSFVCTNGAHEPWVTITVPSSQAKQVQAAVSIDFLHMLIAALYEYDLQGTGILLIDAHYGKKIRAAVQLHRGTIRIAQIYNIINGMHAQVTYDQDSKTLTIDEMLCLLHKGSMRLKHAVLVHDGHDVCFCYAPIVAKNCLATFEHTLFATISGQLTASYKKGSIPRIDGALFLDKSHIKENIFSDTFQKRIVDMSRLGISTADNDIACHVTVETVAPLKVDTPFLKADARMSLKIDNTVHQPYFAGELAVISGSLLFPYRPLHITKGVITMTPHHVQDPLIELVAQNQIRNHAVTMQVTGSLLQHHLMFESTPSLTEQQIIALLLVGSEQESLNIVMPTLIMTNLASLLFGNTQSESMLERCFKRLIQPFKDVHIMPRFSDQTSRGGLRGALDIEVNDRWRAVIQKNFSLTEDTRFELEYQASDDVRVRAIRDEHRDMGAEIEMRWKF